MTSPHWPELYDFFQYKLLQSCCLRLQVGEIPDSIVLAKLRLLDQEHHVLDQTDSIFANSSNLLAWQEIEQSCPIVISAARKFLDSTATEKSLTMISINVGSRLVASASETGDLRAKDRFMHSFVDMYPIGTSPTTCTGETFERAKKHRVVQIALFGDEAIHAAAPLLSHDGRGKGEVELIVLKVKMKDSENK